jgi:hypothetical protein
LAPAEWKVRAIQAPIPWDAPVTNAVLPTRSIERLMGVAVEEEGVQWRRNGRMLFYKEAVPFFRAPQARSKKLRRPLLRFYRAISLFIHA